ncbi:unnamed protein product, partial [Porites evermanni]
KNVTTSITNPNFGYGKVEFVHRDCNYIVSKKKPSPSIQGIITCQRIFFDSFKKEEDKVVVSDRKKKKVKMMEPPPQGEVEDTLKRINSHPGVLGLLVINPQGIAIRSTMDNATTQLYATNFQHLASLARSCVRDLDPLNDLKFLRVRSRKNEIMVAPSKDYTLIVIQNPNHKDV